MFAGIQKRLTEFYNSPAGRITVRVFRYVFLADVVGYLVYQLTQIGWQNLYRSLPVAPLFYLSFFFIYLCLPVAETLIYRSTWHFRFFDAFPAFIKKRVLNKDVLGYSGEVFLYVWAKQRVSLSDRDLLGTIKDNAVVSSVASTIFAVLTLATLFFSRQIALNHSLTRHDAVYTIVAVLVVGALTALAVKFRRTLFRLTGKQLGILFAIHMLRLIATHIFQLVQWWAVLPDVSFQIWFTYLSLLIVTARIPLIPGRDLIFLGASLELSRMMDVSSASIAAMMLVSSVMDKLLNLSFFTSLSLFKRKKTPQVVSLKDIEESLDRPQTHPESVHVVESAEA